MPTNSWDLTPTKDEIMQQIHDGREQYSANFDHDLERIFADLQDREKLNPGPRATLEPLLPNRTSHK
jgi:hypothetical protein